MIDIESEVFRAVASPLRTAYTGVFVAGEYVPKLATFPAVTLIEMDNATDTKTLSSAAGENHADLMYEVNIYTNLKSGKKSQAKAIASVIDGVMLGLGFTRTFMNPVPNYEDSTIFRMTGRYIGKADHNQTIYRR